MEETLDNMVYTLMAYFSLTDAKDSALEAIDAGDVRKARAILSLL